MSISFLEASPTARQVHDLLLDLGSGAVRSTGSAPHRWQDREIALHWFGHFFWPDTPSGEAAAARLAAELRRRPLAEVAAELRGIFGLFVHDRGTGRWCVVTDNAGLFRVYYDDRRISTSFLSLLRARGVGTADLAAERMIEYLVQGNVLGRETVAREVFKLRADEVLETSGGTGAGSAVRVVAKILPSVAAEDADVSAYYDALAAQSRSLPVSIDTTGGLDSRLNVALMAARGARFEMALASRDGTADVRIAKQVADRLGRPLFRTGHRLERLDEELRAAFLLGDGQANVRGLHRDLQLARDRIGRGVGLVLHGGGGEHYRDYFYAHDFPRYGSRRVDFARYYHMRLAPTRFPPEQLAEVWRGVPEELPARAVAAMEPWRRPTNSESYNRVAHRLRAPEFFGPLFSTYIRLGLGVAAPLLDRRLVEIGFAQPPWQAFFALWHRRLITAHAPELASLPTAEGFTVSASPAAIARDLPKIATFMGRRTIRKVGERLLGKPLAHRVGALAAEPPEFVPLLRHSATMRTALQALQRIGLLTPELGTEALRPVHLGRVLTLGLLAEHLESGR